MSFIKVLFHCKWEESHFGKKNIDLSRHSGTIWSLKRVSVNKTGGKESKNERRVLLITLLSNENRNWPQGNGRKRQNLQREKTTSFFNALEESK